MKSIKSFIVIMSALLALLSCREEKNETETSIQGDKKEGIQKNSSEETKNDSLTDRGMRFSSEVECSTFLRSLLSLQRGVRSDPGDTAVYDSLLETAYDTAWKTFYCAGTGIKNPKIPGGMNSVRRTAEITGKRWALYEKLWQEGSQGIRFGDTIKGSINEITQLCSFTSGDTLYLLLQIHEDDVILNNNTTT
ncbi:MAG: hypothetical protein ACOCSE_04465 [Chitinivibrionales bacterium]